jgi:hypothetical protein
MIKKLELGYKGMSKDLAKDKQSDKYFNAKNIRILATDQKSSFSVTNEHGNELLFEIPDVFINISDTRIEYTIEGVLKTIPYETIGSTAPRCEIEEEYTGNTNSGTQIIVGTKDMRNSAIIVTTDGNGFNCFWELTGLNNGSFDLNLLYVRNLNITTANLVQIEYNYENSIIEKIYFVDGKNQLRFMNIRQSVANGDAKNLIDVDSTAIDTVSTFQLSQPQINTSSVVSGGSHTSGMIQYAYSLYVLNGSQTTISPLSTLVPIDKGAGLGGGEVNEALGMSVIVQVPAVDTEFTHIKLYSLKYTSYNQTPEVLEILDREIDNYETFTYYDDGSGGITVSLEQFLFLGSDPIIPKHIATKDNILFPINITEKNFDIDIDARCYSHDSGGTAIVQQNVQIINGLPVGVPETVNVTFDNIPERHDSINRDYETYKFQTNGTTFGGEGKYFKIEVAQSSLSKVSANELQFLKDRELYRFGIVFYNRRGQESAPKWMIDLKAPEGNLEGNYNQIRVEIKSEFYTFLNTIDSTDKDNAPVGYRVVRADRTLSDQTILTQGMINCMQANFNRSGGAKLSSISERRNAVNNNDAKIMPSMTRMFQDSIPFARAVDYLDLTFNGPTSGQEEGNDAEGFATPREEDRRAQTFQHTRLMQMFSPEIMFANIQIDSSYKLNVIGLQRQSAIDNWATEINPISGIKDREATFTNGITSASPGVSTNVVEGPASELSDRSFYGPTNGANTRATQQVHREFLNGHVPTTGTRNWDVYGTPEITETGADFTTYNNISKLRYANNQKSMLLDYWRTDGGLDDSERVQIQGMNTNGAKCITFGIGNISQDVENMRTLESIKSLTGISENDGVLIAEFVKNITALYTGNIYGGFTFEAKSISSYIGIGNYTDMSTNQVLIESPGDTFVQDYTFTKMVKDDSDIVDKSFNIISEIVTVRVESTIDLKNRNDLSIGKWNNRFQPRYSEYQQYNRVYSQQPTLIKKIDPGFKFKKVNSFDARIMASKTKIPGENIDSWTDFLVNETMDLDGKYGPINAVVNSNDIIFTLQDNAVAQININPRAQVVGIDGISLELGSGGILNDYDYRTTKSGCINKWGAIATQNGFYYIDALNKAIVKFDGSIKGISDQEGFHFEFNNVFAYNDLVIDNPVLGTGVSVGYNSVNNDVYFSFLQSENSFTIAYNEATGSFTSYYDYIPAWYINKGSRMITTSPTNDEMWEHFKGTRNNFYGTHFPSSIEFNASPAGKGDVTFNTAEMRMEMLSPTGEDLKNTGLTKIRVYNEYQDSLQKTLQLRTNMFKKNRNWKINLPRVSNSRERIKNPWTFIEFTFDNTAGNRMVMHDITVFYTEY